MRTTSTWTTKVLGLGRGEGASFQTCSTHKNTAGLPAVFLYLAGRVSRPGLSGRVSRLGLAGRVSRLGLAGRVSRLGLAGRVSELSCV
ncbi:hypothetical protein NFI08_02160 [Halomonas sp. EF61]|uniref:hypothetical protein n=1 Tax=Halomonas sp. EF61 TaxID=2950869 RepID=UPI0032DF8320